MELQNIRYIVPAVRDLRVKLSTGALKRRAPRLNYAKARQRWWIHVEFNSEIDLSIFEKALGGSEIRLIELKDAFYVEDPRIPNEAEMSEAFQMAETVIAQLNGATRILCPQFQGTRIESMVELLTNGTGRGIVGYTLAVHGLSDLPAITAFLQSEPAPINAILPVLKTNNDAQEALFYLGAEGNAWANLYKACEVVEDWAGGAKALFQKVSAT